MSRTEQRYARIAAAYEAELGGRAAADVSIMDLLPAIFDAVPDAEPEEIGPALRWLADQKSQAADALTRYRNAKFGNEGKSAMPGDGTTPIKGKH